MSETILIVDDEKNLRKTLAEILRKRGYETLEAADGTEALDILREHVPALIFSDWKMPKLGGEGFLRQMRDDPRLESVPVIVITAFGSSHSAIEAVRLGAYDFVTKPFDLEEIALTAKRALAHASLNRELSGIKASLSGGSSVTTGRLIGASNAMVDVFKLIGKVAETDSTVLICGESGTGKELVAEAIHGYSRRKERPFVAVNCAAIPENLLESELFGYERGAFTGAVARKAGRFEIAEGGTIFLDEIGELPPNLQVKLLRVLQERAFERVGGTETIEVDFRVLAATNRDLEACVREQLFREDLLYRLNVVRIDVPPLRERRSDIVLLAEHFLKRYSERNKFNMVGFSEEAALALQTYSFPGNVRELENMVERAVLMARGRVIMPNHFPTGARDPNANGSATKDSLGYLLDLPFHKALAELERLLIGKAMREAGGNKSDAANRLQINRRLLYNKLDEHKIRDDE